MKNNIWVRSSTEPQEIILGRFLYNLYALSEFFTERQRNYYYL